MLRHFLLMITASLILFPALGHAVTYVCAFECYGTKGKLCQVTFKSTLDGYKDDYHEYFTEENNDFISMSSPYVGKNGAAVFSNIIHKNDLSFVRSTTEVGNTGYREGSCTKIN